MKNLGTYLVNGTAGNTGLAGAPTLHFSLLVVAETGNRGYTLTGRSDYLNPYTVAKRRYAGDLADLKGLLGEVKRLTP